MIAGPLLVLTFLCAVIFTVAASSLLSTTRKKITSRPQRPALPEPRKPNYALISRMERELGISGADEISTDVIVPIGSSDINPWRKPIVIDNPVHVPSIQYADTESVRDRLFDDFLRALDQHDIEVSHFQNSKQQTIWSVTCNRCYRHFTADSDFAAYCASRGHKCDSLHPVQCDCPC